MKGVGGVVGVIKTGDIPRNEEGVRGGLRRVWAPPIDPRRVTPILERGETN